MVSLEGIIESFLAQAPLVAVAVLILYNKIDKLSNEINKVRSEVRSLARSIYAFNDTLIEFLASKKHSHEG